MSCEASLRASIEASAAPVEYEILPCYDLEHHGACVARNEGLARATGDWIAWVDCDDVVERSWMSEIVAAIVEHADCEVIQMDATEVKPGGVTRLLRYGQSGLVSGESFARELLRNDGMPAWLWTRVFRRKVLAGCKFEGRVKQDYQMFLQLLPRISNVWSIGKPLYRYIRHGHGLSNYIQSMDYADAGKGFVAQIEALPKRWLHDARVGLALMMADVARHSQQENGSRYWIRKYLATVLFDFKVPIRLKVKALLAAFGL